MRLGKPLKYMLYDGSTVQIVGGYIRTIPKVDGRNVVMYYEVFHNEKIIDSFKTKREATEFVESKFKNKITNVIED